MQGGPSPLSLPFFIPKFLWLLQLSTATRALKLASSSPLLSPPHTCSVSIYQPDTGPADPEVLSCAPMVQAGGPDQWGKCNRNPYWVYSPFSTSDIYNWKTQTSPFSEKSQSMLSLLETSFTPTSPPGIIDNCYRLSLQMRKEDPERGQETGAGQRWTSDHSSCCH